MHRLRNIRNYSKLIDIKPEVLEALKTNKPIVALESTIITHGMPYPQNLETAIEVENIVRNQGSIPATIAILNGRIKVGLEPSQFEGLAKNGASTVKTSRRDLSYVLSKGLSGGTTVSGTALIANQVGIDVFATGGIGGVHREVEKTFDISADLTELGRLNIAVVSSGVKSILDIPKTLEFLETQGVTCATYNTPEKDFPAFYCRKSGYKAPYNVNDPIEAAKLIATSKTLNLNSSILIAVPVPEEFAMNDEYMNRIIVDALEKAKLSGIFGKDVTPFLLNAIGTFTNNKSLRTNIALIKYNAHVASQISRELSKIKRIDETSVAFQNREIPVVIGGSLVDKCCIVDDYPIKLNGATYHSQFKKKCGGGVGRNIAEGLSKLCGSVEFISKIGDDENGDYLLSLLPESVTRHSIERDPEQSTASCVVILDRNGDSKLYLASMDIHKTIDSAMIKRYEHLIQSAPIVVFDANIPIDGMGIILELCKKYEKPAFFEPTDMLIASKPFELPKHLISQIKFISPNIHELNTIATHLGCGESSLKIDKTDEEKLFKGNTSFMEHTKKCCDEVSRYIDNVIVTLGANGVLVTNKNTSKHKFFDASLRYNKPINENLPVQHRMYNVENDIVNVSGAGDSFTVGFITAMINSCREDICISVGMESAKAALKSESPVPNNYFHSDHECWRQPASHKLL
ncbi:uncharacterized protein LOC129570133 [Sitodiplosis mosellana]|uniref:uncharacterized protein LOC129570133 n=1 Tax=Sitodiplosis mosellana TaxID=263140 RepID=UPI002444B45B|nr:uncharacterized protein LOC129570133 [Sitodiplosis mosellana]